MVLSDGATTVGIPPSLAADDAKAAGVPVFTVALGTSAGTLSDGTPVPPDPEGLQQVADITGGDAFESTDAESVRAVYEQLGIFIGTERVKGEVTAWAGRARRPPAGAGRRRRLAAGAAPLVSFQSPGWLWALVLLVPLAAGLFAWARESRRAGGPLGGSGRDGRRPHASRADHAGRRRGRGAAGGGGRDRRDGAPVGRGDRARSGAAA